VPIEEAGEVDDRNASRWQSPSHASDRRIELLVDQLHRVGEALVVAAIDTARIVGCGIGIGRQRDVGIGVADQDLGERIEFVLECLQPVRESRWINRAIHDHLVGVSNRCVGGTNGDCHDRGIERNRPIQRCPLLGEFVPVRIGGLQRHGAQARGGHAVARHADNLGPVCQRAGRSQRIEREAGVGLRLRSTTIVSSQQVSAVKPFTSRDPITNRKHQIDVARVASNEGDLL